MASVSVMPSSAFQLFPRSWLPYRKVSLQEVKNSPLSDSYQLTDVIESVEAILPMSRTSQSRSMDVATFCNAELNMEHIDAVGFDMDYTLAQYLPSFDLLAYEGTKTKLIESLGYPQLIRDLQYDRDLCQRGCVIDIQRGNILKLDKHRYLRRSQHGLTPMTSNIRKSIYRESYQEAESFTPPDFYNVDSPFSLVDACLFAQLVDLRDRVMAQMLGDSNNHLFFSDKSYKQLWKDMSRCLERCHRDGVIKKTVANNPQDYIIFDPKGEYQFFHDLYCVDECIIWTNFALCIDLTRLYCSSDANEANCVFCNCCCGLISFRDAARIARGGEENVSGDKFAVGLYTSRHVLSA